MKSLCIKTGISSTTLSRAISELVGAGHIDRVKHITNSPNRPSYLYWITQDGYNHLKDNKLFSQKVINAIRYIEQLEYRSDTAKTKRTKKLPISARLLLTFFATRQISNGYTFPFSQADTKKFLKMAPGKYKSALNTLLQEKVIRWYLPGFKSGILVGAESSVVRMNNALTYKLQGLNESTSAFELIDASAELESVDSLFEDISTKYNSNLTSLDESENSNDISSFYHLIAMDYRRVPQIVEHLKIELISLIEIYMCPLLGLDTRKLKTELLNYLVASRAKEQIWSEGYKTLADQLLHAIDPLVNRVVSTIEKYEDISVETHEVHLTIENPGRRELGVRVCHK